MKDIFWRASLVLLLTAVFFSCSKDETDLTDQPVDAETLAVNTWIKENMELYYLWTKYIPEVDETLERDPYDYFDKLLYTTEDKWSWITDDYASLSAELDGVPVTMGFDANPMWTTSAQTSICFIVNFVYPGSVAESAGLKRGDIILKLNGQTITLDNYTDLYYTNSFSVQLADATSSGLVLNSTIYNLVAAQLTTDPSIYNTVFDVDGKKVGYLVFVEFVSGENDVFLDHLDEIFDGFKAEGVTELIVDLRYNPGGSIGTAIHLASLIGPASAVNNSNTLVNLVYNPELQDFFESDSRYDSYLGFDLEPTASNLDLSSVYFLTTSGTASASELVITGLDPYMEVTLIGDYTYGKYVGAWVMPDDNEEWCIVPIVMKYSNADGYTDFKNGLTPDYQLDDEPWVGGYEFGDIRDPFLDEAFTLISGTTSGTVARTKSAIAFPMQQARSLRPSGIKQNLLVPAPTQK